MPASDELLRIKRLYESVVGSRGNSDNHWHEAAKFGSPRDKIFLEWRTPGTKLRQQQYDERAELTLDRAAAMFVAMTSPKHQRYFGLTNLEDSWEDKTDQEVLDNAENVLFDARYRPKGRFSEARSLYAHSLIGFGNGAVFSDTGPNRETPIIYRFCHLSNTHYIVDGLDNIIGVFGSRKLGAEQILLEFGEENVSSRIKEEAAREQDTQNQEDGGKYNVVHCVKLNDNYNPAGNISNENMLYSSYHFIQELPDDGFLKEGGYRTMPYAITRDEHLPYEIYGRGTLQKILHTIKMGNSMKRDHIAAGHNLATPALLLRDDSSFNAAQLRPNSMVIGGLDAQGNETVKPLNKGINFDVSEIMLKEVGDIIEKAFNMDLFISNVSETRDRVTATEILTRTQEQARIAGPLAARDEDQFQNALVERELDILINDWDMIEGAEDFTYKLTFKSQMSFAQRADDVVALTRVIEGIQLLAQFDPTVINMLDPVVAIQIFAESNGLPAKALRSREQFDEINEEARQAQVGQSVLDNAGGIAQGIVALEGSPDEGAV